MSGIDEERGGEAHHGVGWNVGEVAAITTNAITVGKITTGEDGRIFVGA